MSLKRMDTLASCNILHAAVSFFTSLASSSKGE